MTNQYAAFSYHHNEQASSKKKEGRNFLPSLSFCVYSILEREPQTDFENSASVGRFDIAIATEPFECRIVRIGVIHITPGIIFDVEAASSHQVDDVEIGADAEGLSDAESLLYTHIEGGHGVVSPRS